MFFNGVARNTVILSLSKDGHEETVCGAPILRQAQDDTLAAQDDTLVAQDDTLAAQDDTGALLVRTRYENTI